MLLVSNSPEMSNEMSGRVYAFDRFWNVLRHVQRQSSYTIHQFKVPDVCWLFCARRFHSDLWNGMENEWKVTDWVCAIVCAARVCAWKVCLLCEKLANFPPFCNGCCDMGLGLFCAFNMRICFWHGSSFFFVVALSLYHQFHSFIIFDAEKCGFRLLFVHYVWVCGFVRSITITGATAAKHDCVCILIYGFFVVPKWTAQTVLSTCIFWPESNWIKLCVKWQHSQRVNEQARWLYPMCFPPTTANPMAHCGCVVQLFKGNY